MSTLSTGVSSLSTGLSTTNSTVAAIGAGVASALGGGAAYNAATGAVTAPSYTVNNSDGTTSTVNNVGDALTSINTQGIKYFHANSTLADSQATGANAVAVGPQAVASGTSSVAVGLGAQATGANAVAVGSGAQASGSGTAIGFGAIVQSAGGVALGSGSVASTAAGVAGYVPATATAAQTAAIRATTSTQAAVSVGDAASGQFRQITGVAAGTSDSDAVNVSQLRVTSNQLTAQTAQAKAGSVQYNTALDGTVDYSQVTLGNGQAPNGTRVSNVAPGIAGTDAVNLNQLNAVQGQIGEVARVAYSGVAMAFAMAGTYLPTLYPGEKTVGVGIGVYQGYTAIGLTFKALSDKGDVAWGAGVSGTSRNFGVNAGIGWKWK